MAWWDDLSRFAGNLTGGFIGESDEERRRKRQQQQQASSGPSLRVNSTPSNARVSASSGSSSPQPRISVNSAAPSASKPKPTRGLTVRNDDFDVDKGLEALKKAPGEFAQGVLDVFNPASKLNDTVRDYTLRPIARIPETVARTVAQPLVDAIKPGASASQKEKNTGVRGFLYGEEPIKTYHDQTKEVQEFARTNETAKKFGLDKVTNNAAFSVLGAPFIASLDIGTGGRGKSVKKAGEELAADVIGEAEKEAAEAIAKEVIGNPTVDKEQVLRQLEQLRSGGKREGYVEKEAPAPREVSAEALLARATKEASMSEASATKLMNSYGRNKFTIMLDESNNLSGANNPNALAASVLKKIPDGDVMIGGTAARNDLMAKVAEVSETPAARQVAETPSAGGTADELLTQTTPARDGKVEIDDPLYKLRQAREGKLSDGEKADVKELTYNALERTMDDAEWQRASQFINLGSDNDLLRMGKITDERLSKMAIANQDRFRIVANGDQVQYIDPRTGEVLAQYHRDDLVGKVEALSATQRHLNQVDDIPTAAPDAPGAPKATGPMETPKSVEDVVGRAPERGDLDGYSRHIQEIEAYSMRLADEASAELAKHGYTFEDMVRIIDDGRRALDDGAEQVNIPDPVYDVYQKLRADMDKAYGHRQSQKLDGRKNDDFGSIDELYWPRSTGADRLNSSLSDRIGDASVLSRTGRDMSQESMDMSPASLSRYMVEMLGGEDNRRILEIVNEAAAEGRQLTPTQAMKVADEENLFLQNVDSAAKLGKDGRPQVDVSHLGDVKTGQKNVRHFPFVESLASIGRAKGLPTTQITTPMRKGFYLEAFRQLGSVPIGNNRTLEDIGITQFYRATKYADDLYQGGGDIMEDLQAVFPELKPDDLTALSRRAEGALGRYSDEAGDIGVYTKHVYETTYRQAAARNITNFLETHEITDKNARDLLSYQVAPILTRGKIEQNFGQKLARAYTSMTDRSLRGWNIKSALVEFTEAQKIPNIFGVRNAAEAAYEMKNPKNLIAYLEKWGKQDTAGAAREFFEGNPTVLDQLGDLADKNGFTKAVKTAADPRAMLKGVELWRSAVALRAAELHNIDKGLTGRQLTDRTWDDFRKAMLPSDQETSLGFQRNAFTRAVGQYQQWNIRNMSQDARLIGGIEHIGKVQGRKGQLRYGGMTLVNKTALWMAYAGTGSTAAYVFNIYDPFGILDDKWNGVNQEDMTATDYAVQAGSFSPMTSLAGSAYFAWRQEQERVEMANDDNESYRVADKDKTYKQGNVVANFQEKATYGNLIPGSGQFKKSKGMDDLQRQGYYDGKDGRVRYESATNPVDIGLGYIFGKGATRAAKEYNDTPNPWSKASKGDLEGFLNEARKDPLLGKVFGSTKERQRPLSISTYDKGYNERAKEAFAAQVEKHGLNSPEARETLKSWIKLGRAYNNVLDKFKKDSPADYETLQRTFDDNMVSPEKWSIYKGNPKIFEFAKQRKLLEERDLGRTIDPIYKLDPERAKVILQYRGMHTGDDMKHQSFLYQKDWYQGFQDQYSKYINSLNGDREMGPRLKEWDGFSKELAGAKNLPEFNLVKQLNDLGYGTPESKAFLRNNYDAWKAQKDAYDKYRLERVNKMRKIEGVEEMNWEQFTAKIEFESQGSEDSSGNGYSKNGKRYSRGGGSSSNPPNTGVASTITSLGNDGAGMKLPTGPKGKLKDVRKVVKTKRAKRTSPIRIRI